MKTLRNRQSDVAERARKLAKKESKVRRHSPRLDEINRKDKSNKRRSSNKADIDKMFTEEQVARRKALRNGGDSGK